MVQLGRPLVQLCHLKVNLNYCSLTSTMLQYSTVQYRDKSISIGSTWTRCGSTLPSERIFPIGAPLYNCMVTAKQFNFATKVNITNGTQLNSTQLCHVKTTLRKELNFAIGIQLCHQSSTLPQELNSTQHCKKS